MRPNLELRFRELLLADSDALARLPNPRREPIGNAVRARILATPRAMLLLLLFVYAVLPRGLLLARRALQQPLQPLGSICHILRGDAFLVTI